MSQLRLTKIQREQYEAILAELEPWGLHHEVVTHQGSHIKVVVAGPPPHGGHWPIALSASPRDAGGSVRFVRSQTKKLVRKINARRGL